MKNSDSSLQQGIIVGFMWLLLPLLALHFVSIWNALPARIPSHFDLQGRANGWQSPQTLAGFALGALLLALAIFSFAIGRAFRVRSMIWAVTFMAYGIVGLNFTLFWQLLDHAAYGRAMSEVWPMPAGIPLLGLVLAAILLAQQPASGSRPSATATLIAEEQHRSLVQLLFILPGLLIGVWFATRAVGPPRLLGVVMIAAMAWIALAAVDGFRYFIRSDGVQIRGFLLPLRFIPRSSIRSYQPQTWKGLGYGIRLTSTGTAYIWGGRNVVNIVTDSGDVMLGHRDPERLIHDLDQMMQSG
ncbi:MAG: DUF1648 domain-containing protein [Acidobacteria bacterium]|nr:DUF1648 domain-containing protein [Acidobacteriota bacterium]MBV9146741.1 DUF1648 domain-containing protein [Acidobacteriota bacterium]